MSGHGVIEDRHMSNIVEFCAIRDAADRPDVDCTQLGTDGTELFLFAIDYRVGEKAFGLEIWAHSFAEAQAHVECIRNSASLAGQIKSRGTL
jgi:hypothetical protein